MSQKNNLTGMPPVMAGPAQQSGLQVMSGSPAMMQAPANPLNTMSPTAQNFMRGKARLFGLGQGTPSSNPTRPQGQESNSMLRFSY